MPHATPIQNSFNGGEISPRLQSRVDQAIYQISTAEMENFVPTIEGPALKRSGFRHIRAAQATASWLSPFIFSTSQAYVLEWGEALLRFYTNGGRVEADPVTPLEVVVPYTAAEAPEVSQQQSYDRLYLAHGSHPPASLLRTSATTFTYAALTLKNGPFATRNSDEAVTIQATATTGNVTINSNTAIFLAGHVGAPFMIEALGFGDIKAWEPQARVDGDPVQLAVGDLRRSDGKVYRCAAIAGVRTGTIQPTHTRGSEWDGSGQSILGYDTQTAGVQWEYLYDALGVGTIAAVNSPTQAVVTVTRRFADNLLTQPSYRFYMPAFSAATGWPKHVLLAFGRLIFFTDFEIVASVVGDFGGGTVNMAPFTDGGLFTPDMAFHLRLDISNPILWAKADRDVILVGTADGIYAIRKINSGQTFSSDNVECVKQTHVRAATVPPAQTGTSTVFVQAGGRKLREAQYDLQADRYPAANIVVWQRHILKSGVRQLTFQAEPEELLCAVRNDGELVVHPHVPEQEVKGFARIVHGGGAIVSGCAIPDEDGKDQLWVLVSGDAGLSVQLQEAAWEEGETALEDAFFVDSGATYSGPETTTVTGLTHLASQSVAVLADGAVVSGRAVDVDGVLTLPFAASTVQVGKPFTARLTWLRPEVGDPSGGTRQGKIKRLVDLALRLLDTGGVKVDAGAGHVDELIDRPVGATIRTPVPLLSGDTRKPVGGAYGRDGQATIISDEPLPCMVVATLPKFEMSER